LHPTSQHAFIGPSQKALSLDKTQIPKYVTLSHVEDNSDIAWLKNVLPLSDKYIPHPLQEVKKMYQAGDTQQPS
jgi:hypothetical protein